MKIDETLSLETSSTLVELSNNNINSSSSSLASNEEDPINEVSVTASIRNSSGINNSLLFPTVTTTSTSTSSFPVISSIRSDILPPWINRPSVLGTTTSSILPVIPNVSRQTASVIEEPVLTPFLTHHQFSTSSVPAPSAAGGSSDDPILITNYQQPIRSNNTPYAHTHSIDLRNELGELLYPRINTILQQMNIMQQLTGKITGMLLELDEPEIRDLLSSTVRLETRIREAYSLLVRHGYVRQ